MIAQLRVQLLGDSLLGVSFQSRCPGTGRLYWRQSPGEDWRLARENARDGLLGALGAVHHCRLAGYDPARPLYYRPALLPIAHFAPYKVDFEPEVQGPEGRLRPLLGPEGGLNLAVVCDLHNQPGLLDPLLDRSPEATLCVFNGDTCDAPNSREELESNLAAPLARATGRGLASLFVRGNHETRGAGARLMPEYLQRPADRYYGALTLGPVRVVFLDTGEDKPADHEEYSGLIDFADYLAEEAAWLRQEVAGAAWNRAPWRLVFMHIPPRPFPGVKPYPVTENGHRIFAPILQSQHVDLVVSGHEHVASFLGREEMWQTYGLDFPLIVGGGGWHHPERLEALTLEITSKEIKVPKWDFSLKKC